MKFLNILLLSMSLLFVSCDEDTKEDIKNALQGVSKVESEATSLESEMNSHGVSFEVIEHPADEFNEMFLQVVINYEKIDDETLEALDDLFLEYYENVKNWVEENIDTIDENDKKAMELVLKAELCELHARVIRSYLDDPNIDDFIDAFDEGDEADYDYDLDTDISYEDDYTY